MENINEEMMIPNANSGRFGNVSVDPDIGEVVKVWTAISHATPPTASP